MALQKKTNNLMEQSFSACARTITVTGITVFETIATLMYDIKMKLLVTVPKNAITLHSGQRCS